MTETKLAYHTKKEENEHDHAEKEQWIMQKKSSILLYTVLTKQMPDDKYAC